MRDFWMKWVRAHPARKMRCPFCHAEPNTGCKVGNLPFPRGEVHRSRQRQVERLVAPGVRRAA